MSEYQAVDWIFLGALIIVYLAIVPLVKRELRLFGFERPRTLALFWPVVVPIVLGLALLRMFVED